MPASNFSPISIFDPTKPALLHDDVSDQIVPWAATAEDVKSWRENASRHGDEETMEWDGLLIDGWTEPLGG